MTCSYDTEDEIGEKSRGLRLILILMSYILPEVSSTFRRKIINNIVPDHFMKRSFYDFVFIPGKIWTLLLIDILYLFPRNERGTLHDLFGFNYSSFGTLISNIVQTMLQFSPALAGC